MHGSLRRLASLPDDLTVLPGHDYGPAPHGKIGGEKVTNMMIRQALLQASPADFAATLQRLSAPRLIVAEGRRRRGPTGSRVQAVTAACCAVYAGATGTATTFAQQQQGCAEDGEAVEEGLGAMYCVDLGRAAQQAGAETQTPGL